ncbi:NAD(P)H-binding protein [Bradyrhizobium sp. AZCC 2262]|uniref:NAD(P)H-binding protein n=1 Tax=Bradyrhizobium sp. AZCC 2262 TaxID=3117022 RepID=UPI003FA58E12
MDIGIIGATGNIGQRVVREAHGRDHRVTGFTRDPAKLQGADPDISWKAIDVLDAGSVRRVIGGLDVLISLYQPGNAAKDFGASVARAIADPSVYVTRRKGPFVRSRVSSADTADCGGRRWQLGNSSGRDKCRFSRRAAAGPRAFGPSRRL